MRLFNVKCRITLLGTYAVPCLLRSAGYQRHPCQSCQNTRPAFPDARSSAPSDAGVTPTRDPCGMCVRQEALPVAPSAVAPVSCTASRAPYCFSVNTATSGPMQDAITESRASTNQQRPEVCCSVCDNKPCHGWTWDCRPLLVAAGRAPLLLAAACGALNRRVLAQLMAEGLPL